MLLQALKHHAKLHIKEIKETVAVYRLASTLRKSLAAIDGSIVVTTGTLASGENGAHVAFARVRSTQQLVVSARFLYTKAKIQRVPVGRLVYQLQVQLEHECQYAQHDLASLY